MKHQSKMKHQAFAAVGGVIIGVAVFVTLYMKDAQRAYYIQIESHGPVTIREFPTQDACLKAETRSIYEEGYLTEHRDYQTRCYP